MSKYVVGQQVKLHTKNEGEITGTVTASYSLAVARRLRLIKGMHGKSGTVLEIQTEQGNKVYKHQSTVKEV